MRPTVTEKARRNSAAITVKSLVVAGFTGFVSFTIADELLRQGHAVLGASGVKSPPESVAAKGSERIMAASITNAAAGEFDLRKPAPTQAKEYNMRANIACMAAFLSALACSMPAMAEEPTQSDAAAIRSLKMASRPLSARVMYQKSWSAFCLGEQSLWYLT